MTYEKLLEHAQQMERELDDGKNVLSRDSKIIEFLFDNCEITIPEESKYFVRVNTGYHGGRIMRDLMSTRRRNYPPKPVDDTHRVGLRNCAFSGNSDFGHTAPVWDHIFALGIDGMKKRIENRTGPAINPDFVESQVRVFEAAQRFMLRAADEADKVGKHQMAQGIRNLTYNPPSDLFEAFQLPLVFYCLMQFFEATDIRTLGRLDQLLLPFYEQESDQEKVMAMALDFMREIDALKAPANMPFAIAGTDGDGRSMVNPMSYVFLKAYAATKLPETKLHILCTEDMPRDFMQMAMECVKDGGNSLVFINNKLIVDGLMKLGLSAKDAAGYAIVGCYEASGREEVPCSCNARVSIPKALEATLHGGHDALTGTLLSYEQEVQFSSFEALYKAFLGNLKHFVTKTIELTNVCEKNYPLYHSSPLFSATMEACVEKGGDAYADFAAAYNNSSINVIGLATAVDSLYAIKKLVFDDKRMSLQELIAILDSNWQGQEALRNLIRNKFPKYGVGDKNVDHLASQIVDFLSDNINNVPNAKGGVYRMGVFSIDWRVKWGEHTAASADGRLSAETLSQNASATFGMDKEGPTGHILSVSSLNGVNAVNGSILDLDLHSSAVRGKNGTNVLLATLDTFLEKGGQTIHYNVLDTETLRDAQEHPEKYPNLQVRLCGWNVLFTHLSKASQDEFIHRSEMQAG